MSAAKRASETGVDGRNPGLSPNQSAGRILPKADPAKPWPRDWQGYLLPGVPVRGLRLESWGRGQTRIEYRVATAGKAAFVVLSGTEPEEFPLAAWAAWLDSLSVGEHSWITVHLPKCRGAACRGCDGSGVGRPSSVAPVPLPWNGGPMPDFPRIRRRQLRAVLERAEPGGAFPELRVEALGPRRQRVSGPDGRFETTISPEWTFPARCTCPHFSRNGGEYCRHLIAAMQRDEGLRCQLIEMFL